MTISLQSLPDNVLRHIFSYTTANNLTGCSTVCTKFKILIDNENLFPEHYLKAKEVLDKLCEIKESIKTKTSELEQTRASWCGYFISHILHMPCVIRIFQIFSCIFPSVVDEMNKQIKLVSDLAQLREDEATTASKKALIASGSITKKLFCQDLYISGSLTPYKIIRYITRNKLHSTIEHVVNLVYSKGDSSFSNVREKEAALGSEMPRNCTNTAYTLAFIFLGLEVTKKLADYHIKVCNVDINIQLPSGKDWIFTVNELFDGNVSHEISNDAKFHSMNISQQVEIANNYRTKHIIRFINSIQPVIDKVKNCDNQNDEEMIKNLAQEFSVFRYNFNKITIELLQKDILERNEKVNSKKSFIYVCRSPISDPQLGKERLIEHAWILEQFFSESTQKVAYRLYQSWIGQATLSDEFDKRKYGPNGENYWNLDEIKEFLNNLNAYYCSDHTEKASTTSQECFGYTAPSFPLLKFDGRSFFGKHLQYKIYEIEPAQCINHFKLLDCI
jgi:hypothetical protein